MAFELAGDLVELKVQGGQDPDQGGDSGAVGLSDHRGGLQLRGAQGSLQLGRTSFHAALAAGPAQGRGQPGPRQAPAKDWGGRQLEHRQGVTAAQVTAEGRQGTRVELPQQAAQLVELPLAGPDRGSGESGPAP